MLGQGSNLWRLGAFFLLICSANLTVLGQEIDKSIEKAQGALAIGDYLEARKLFRPFFDNPMQLDRAAAHGYFETFLARGEYEEALGELDSYLSIAPEDPSLLHAKGRLLIATGKYAQAQELLMRVQEMDADYPENLLALGELMELTGRRNQGYQYYTEIARSYSSNQFRTARSIGIAGRAYARLHDFHEANQIFRIAYQMDSRDTQVLLWWGELFREKYNNADAKRTLEEALAINPHKANLHVGFAKALDGFSQIEEIANKALLENPKCIGAMNLLAELNLIDSRYEEAETILKNALEINPVDELSLANLASIYHLMEQSEEFKEIENRILAVNPRCTDFYTILAENCVRRFRYKDTIYFCQQAIGRDRQNWQAYAILGSNLLRIGNVEDARLFLDRAFRGDPFNLFARNSLELIDEYKNFETLESEHFDLIIHQSERDILGRQILDLAEVCYDSLTQRYPYRPAGKIRIEAYNDHDDFGVRISGLPGIGLLGVCFGDVIALDTPKAQAGSEYNWSRTLWHELAHVMALGISDHKVPRWFTEGLSVYEEMMARPEWRRQMDLEIYAALEQGLLLTFSEINKGFTRPKFPEQIMLTYYQSAKWIGYISKRYGFQSIVDLLSAFGLGKDLAAAFDPTLGKTVTEVENMLFSDLRAERDRYKSALTDLPPLFNHGPEMVPFSHKLFESDNPLFDNIRAGYKHLENKELDESETRFLKAIDLFPHYSQKPNAYQGLAEVYRQRGETDKLVDLLERYVTVSEFAASEARELAGLYEDLGEIEKAEKYYLRSMQVEPYDQLVHLQLAQFYREKGEFHKEIEARRSILALQPLDIADAHYNLAMSLYDNGQKSAAKLEVLRSLDLAPGFRDAQKLLLRCVNDQN